MDKYWSPLKNKNHDGSFWKIESWIRDVENQKSKSKSEREINIMKDFIIANKYKFAVVILAAILVYACSLPVTEEKTVGHVLSWTVEGKNIETVEKIEKLSWLEMKQLKKKIIVKDNIETITYDLILPNSTEEQLNSYRKELEGIENIKSINVLPLQESVTRPVYSEVLHSVFKIDMDATNKSDKEVVSEITEQLEKAGLENVKVNFEKQPEGYRKLKITIPEGESNLKNSSIDMKIRDENIEEHLKTETRVKMDCDGNKFKGKTDEEIKLMLMEDLKDKNISKDDIKITREGNKINVKVQKELKKDHKNIEKKIELKNIEE